MKNRMNFKKVIIMLICIFSLTGFYCSTAPKTTTSTTTSTTSSTTGTFAADVQPIFTNSCATGSCHVTGSKTVPLDLTSGNAYTNIYNITSTQDPTKKYVVPSSSATSYLYIKLTGAGVTGTQMPKGGSLTQTQIDTIKSWIDAGALNN
ncbi:MAG: hypothetical protein OEV66_08045 [Spirochaetia bacterium]|nr:hypothetical protein [Spirochaetia bacterium]